MSYVELVHVQVGGTYYITDKSCHTPCITVTISDPTKNLRVFVAKLTPLSKSHVCS